MAFDTAVTILTQPKKGFRELAHLPMIYWSAAIIFLSQISRTLGTAAGSEFLFSSGDILFQGVSAVLKVFFISLLLFGMGKLFRGSAGLGQVFQAYAFAGLPYLFGGPFSLAAALMGLPLAAVPAIIYSLVILGLEIWSLGLIIIGFKETQEFSWGKTILALVVMVILLLFLSLAIGIILI